MTQLSEYDLDQRYREFLNECYETVNICGYEYEPARALEEVDPTAYRCGFNDWLDAELGETIFVNAKGEYFDSDPENESED